MIVSNALICRGACAASHPNGLPRHLVDVRRGSLTGHLPLVHGHADGRRVIGLRDTVRVQDRIYTELADEYDRSSATGPSNALYDRPTILQLLGPWSDGRSWSWAVRGHLTQQLVDGGAAVVAADKSEEMVRGARRRLASFTI